MTTQNLTIPHVLVAILDLLGSVAKKVDAMEARSKGNLPSTNSRKRHIKAHVRVALSMIVTRTAEVHERTIKEILSDNRSQAIAHARQASMAACRDAGHVLEDIAIFMRRDVSTVRHGIEMHRKRTGGAA